MSKYTTQRFTDNNGKHRFRVNAANGNILAKCTKAFATKELMEDVLRLLRLTSQLTKQKYKDTRGEWRWRLVAGKKILCVSSEGYVNKGDCKNILNNITFTD
jgi:uncharacterized protein YegP (UPF0339 family)